MIPISIFDVHLFENDDKYYPTVRLLFVPLDRNRLLGALKTDFVSVAARSIAAPAAGERHRAGEGALEKEEAKELVGEAVAEAVGAWGVLVENLWEKATSQVAEKCMAMLQVGQTILQRVFLLTAVLPDHGFDRRV